MREEWTYPPLRCLAALLLLSGCARDCAGPLSDSVVARAAGPAWRAELRCEPRTQLGAGRGDLLERQGCTARATLVVEGRAHRVEQTLHRAFHDRDCGRVRAYCRAARGRVVTRETPEGAVVGAAIDGAGSSLVAYVTAEGFAFRRDDLPVSGAPAAAVAAAETPDALLTALLRDGLGHAPRPGLGGAFRGATLRRLRGPLLEASARCAAPVEALESLARDEPAVFETLYASGWSPPRCAHARLALERASRDRVSERVRAQLAATRATAAPEALDPLVITAGRLAVRAALPDLMALARVAPGPRGADEALWIHAVWAWSRVDREGAASACASMLRARPHDAVAAERPPRPFDEGVPRWDPPAVVLARCVASSRAVPPSPAPEPSAP